MYHRLTIHFHCSSDVPTKLLDFAMTLRTPHNKETLSLSEPDWPPLGLKPDLRAEDDADYHLYTIQAAPSLF
jgi:hypothetical protein